jgi:hypothetical protein
VQLIVKRTRVGSKEDRTLIRKMTFPVLISGVAVGLGVTCVMTYLDWNLNRSGVFRNQQGTEWSAVLETALSWFAAMFLPGCLPALPAVFRLSRHA